MIISPFLKMTSISDGVILAVFLMWQENSHTQYPHNVRMLDRYRYCLLGEWELEIFSWKYWSENISKKKWGYKGKTKH